MSITAQDIKETFPEFTGLSSVVVERWLTQAERRVNRVQWSGKADDGVLWLTAHLLKVQCTLSSGGMMPPGPITQKKTGDLSESYATPSAFGRSQLSSTTYGQYFLDLQRGIFSSRVLGDCCNDA